MLEVLSVDIGNTRTGFAVVRDGEVVDRWDMPTHDAGREIAIPDSMQASVKEVGICSVVPGATPLISAQIASRLNIEPWIIEAERVSWFVIHYDPLNSLGADRLCAVIAARERVPWPAVVIDCGTATTCSVIDVDGNFAGGVIAPGFDMLAGAIATGTARLPRPGDEMPIDVLATNTEDAVQGGVTRLFVSGVGGILERIKMELGGHVTVVLTGGRGQWLKRYLAADCRWEPDLVHLGVYEYARRIRAKA
ncbi:MAG: type III pantothenate kinase [Chlorobi bacterium]|nr:type III pantothenate kinase [Chlorobiota bacterium]